MASRLSRAAAISHGQRCPLIPAHVHPAPGPHITILKILTTALPQDRLHFEHRVEVPVKCVGGVLYVRISAHVYNTRPDYERLAAAALALAAAGGSN